MTNLEPPKSEGPREEATREFTTETRRISPRVKVVSTVLVGGVVTLVLALLLFWHTLSELPAMVSVADYKPLGVTKVLTKDNLLLSELFKERRYLVPFEKLPPLVVKAFVSAEDDQFFEHQGFNPVAMLRASLANFRAGHVVQGGSTITQQVAKSLFLSPDRNIARKVKELILARRIEKNLSKQQILYLYLNQIYLGQGAHGIQAASRVYFGKDVKDLALPELALFAGLPRAPSKYSPFANPQKAKERQIYVLRRMQETGAITRDEMTAAIAAPLKVFHNDVFETRPGAYLLEMVRRYLVQRYGEKAVLEDGLTVHLPVTLKNLKLARQTLMTGLREFDKRKGYRGATRKIVNEEEYQKFIAEKRDEAIRRRVPYALLMPDGRLGIEETLAAAGVKSEKEILLSGETYEGVVTAVDDKALEAKVHLGVMELRLPMEKMSWAFKAQPAVKDPNEEKLPPAPTKPSEVVTAGDVVLVRVASTKKPPEPGKKQGEIELLAELEQEPEVQGALYSYEARTGTILGLEGGANFVKSEFNRAIQAQRQPGSAFKPIIFSAAVEKGYTPATVIVDSPLIYADTTGKWKPSNYDEKFHGDTLFRQALIHSRNIPTIKIVQDIQVSRLIEHARRLGITGHLAEDLSISLGSGTLTLQELTHAYGLFPRLGHRVTPTFVSKVVDRDGRVLEENLPQPLLDAQMLKLPPVNVDPVLVDGSTPQESPEAPQKFRLPSMPPVNDPDWVLDPRVAYVMTHLMKEVVEYGTGQRAKGAAKAVAGKTGTTNDFLDAWFVGFSPHIVTGVWVGYDELRTLGQNETGARAALPIWTSFMTEVSKSYPETDFVVPSGIKFLSIDSRTGNPTSSAAPFARTEAFIEGTEPTRTARSSKRVEENESEFLRED